MPSPWNPSATIVGQEWMPTIEDAVSISSDVQGVVLSVPSTATETIRTIFFKLGRSISPGSVLAVDVYEDTIPLNPTISAVNRIPTSALLSEYPGSSAEVTMRGSSPWWMGYGIPQGERASDDPTGGPSKYYGGRNQSYIRVRDSDDYTGVYVRYDIGPETNPGPYIFYKASTIQEDYDGTNGPLRQILGFEIEARMRNFDNGKSGKPITVYHILHGDHQGVDPYVHSITPGTVLEPSGREDFWTWTRSGPLFIDPANNGPWFLRGNALKYICNSVDGNATLRHRFGVRVQSAAAYGQVNSILNPLPAISMSEVRLRTYYLNETRVASGFLKMPTSAEMSHGGGFVGLDTERGVTTEDGWVGIHLYDPAVYPIDLVNAGLAKQNGHRYFFVLRLIPDISIRTQDTLSDLYGTVDIGSFSIVRIGETTDRFGPKGITTDEVVFANNGGVVLNVARSSTRLFAGVLVKTNDTTSTDSTPYHNFEGLSVAADPTQSVEQEVTPTVTVSNLRALRAVFWAPDYAPSGPLNVRVMNGGTVMASGEISIDELGDASSVPGEHVILLSNTITLNVGTTYKVQFYSEDTAWRIGTVFHDDGIDAGPPSYGGSADSAAWLGKTLEADVPVTLHLVPAAPTFFSAQPIATRVD